VTVRAVPHSVANTAVRGSETAFDGI